MLCSLKASIALALALALALASTMTAAMPAGSPLESRGLVTVKLEYTHTTCAANAVKRFLKDLIDGGQEGDLLTVENCPAIGKTRPSADLCYTTCVGPDVELVTLNLVEPSDGWKLTTCGLKSGVGGCWFSTRDGSVLGETPDNLDPAEIASEEACKNVKVEKGTCV